MALELEHMHHMPTIKLVMTPFPFFVEIDASISDARAMMREHDIHHLPVMEDGALIGVLSEREVRLLEASRRGAGDGVRVGDVRVGDVCVRDVYTVDVDTPLDEVLRALAESHVGSALVLKNAKLVGIMTASDVCRVLAEVLQHRFPAPPEGDAAA